MSEALANLEPDKQRVVRTRVRELLGQSSAFNDLPPADRRELANKLVNTVAYLADPAAGERGLSRALAGDKAKHEVEAKDLKEDIVQKDFTAAATGAAGGVMQDLKNAVDFVEFVKGLIQGVFQSIVDASIQQMEAYQELLSNVVKSVNEFATDNFTENQGRDYLSNRFPSLLNLNTMGQQPRLELTDRADEEGLGELQSALGLGEGRSISMMKRARPSSPDGVAWRWRSCVRSSWRPWCCWASTASSSPTGGSTRR